MRERVTYRDATYLKTDVWKGRDLGVVREEVGFRDMKVKCIFPFATGCVKISSRNEE